MAFDSRPFMDLLGDQMTKTLLLTAAAVTALVAAGSAQAGSLSARAGNTGAGVAVAPNNPYRLAQELNFGAGVPSSVGQFDTVFTFNTPLQAGSYTVTLAYSGATISSAVPSTTVNSGTAAVANPTAAFGFEVSGSGGTPGDFVNGANGASQLTVTGQTATQITFALQIPAGNSVTSIYAAPALLVTGPVSVTAAVTNQITGAVTDPAVIQPLITTGTRGFAQAISGAVGGAAGADTRIAEGATPPTRFSTLSGDAAVGAVLLGVYGDTTYDAITGATTVGTSVYKDLNGTAVALADVQSQTVSVTGNIANLQFSSAGPINFTGTGANTQTTTLTGGVNTTTVNVAPVVTTGNTRPQLAPTALTGTASYTLAAAFAAQAGTTGSFENIQTDGFSYIIPWVASQTQSGASGNQSVIRVSNIASDAATAGGNVYVQVYNPTTGNAAVAAGRSVLVGTLGSSGELVLTSQSLEAALGNFGRADLRLTITTSATTGNALPGGVGTTTQAVAGPPAVPETTTTTLGASTIVVKRLIATSNGGLTEVEILAGDASTSANAPALQGVNY